MNRHARRAVGKNKRLAASLGGLSEAAEKMHPVLDQIEELKTQLTTATTLLHQARQRNEALVAALGTQQEIYFRLFAIGMSCTRDEVVSMAMEIQAQLTRGETHGITDTRTAGTEEDPGHSASPAEDRLAEATASSDSSR